MTLTVPSQKRGRIDHIHYACSSFQAMLVNSSAYLDFASECFDPWESGAYLTIVYFALNACLLVPTVALLVRFYWRGGRAPSPQKVTFWVILCSCLLNTVFPALQYYGYLRSQLSAFCIEVVGIGLHTCILLFLGMLMHDALPPGYSRGAVKGRSVSSAAKPKRKWFGGVFKRPQVELSALISVSALTALIVMVVGFGSTVFNCQETLLQGPLFEGLNLALDALYVFIAGYFAWRGGKVLGVLKDIAEALPDDVRTARLKQVRSIRLLIVLVMVFRGANFASTLAYFTLSDVYTQLRRKEFFLLFEMPIGLPLQTASAVWQALELLAVIVLLGRKKEEGKNAYKGRASLRLSTYSNQGGDEGRRRLISSGSIKSGSAVEKAEKEELVEEN